MKPFARIASAASSLAGEYRRAFSAFSRNAKLFLLGSFLLDVGANQISLLWSLYLKGLGDSPSRIGLTLAARALGSTILALPASLAIAKINPRRLLPATAVLVAAAYVAQSLVTDGNAILASVFLAGAGSTVFQVIAGPFFMRNSGPEERVHLFSLNAALSMGTGLIGSLAGGFLKDGLVALGMCEVLAYRVALLAGAAFVLASALPFALIGKSEAADSGSAEEASAGGEGKIPLTLWVKLILPSFLVGIGAGLTIPYLNLYFKMAFGLDDGAVGAAVAAGQVATFIGMAASPAIARRMGKARSVVLTQAVSIPLILVLAFIGSLPLALIAYLGRQVLMNMSTPIQDNFTLEIVPRSKQGVVNAMRMLAWTGSWTIAARISGELIDRGGFGTSFVLTAALYALSTLSFWIFFIWKRNFPAAR